MIDTIKKIGKHLNTFHECLNEELPLDFDYDNEVGMYFELNTILGHEYKDVITLDIHFVSLKSKLNELLFLVDTVDKETNKKIINNIRITKKPVWLIDTKDDEYEHWILSYNLNKY